MKAKFVYESLSDILKPKEGAIEELQKWELKNLMAPMDEEGLHEWMLSNNNLAKALEYKGRDDAQNIVGFDLDTMTEEFPGDYNLFRNLLEKAGFVPELKIPKEYGGGLELFIGRIKDGSKIIFYRGGLVDGYIARKEWLK